MYARLIIATQAIGARQLFPCWDDPSLKAMLTISVNHPESYNAFSNMPNMNLPKRVDETKMKWTHFETTPKISTDRIGFVVHDFNLEHTQGINIWCRQQVQPLLKHGKIFIDLTIKHLKTYWQFLETSTFNDTRIH